MSTTMESSGPSATFDQPSKRARRLPQKLRDEDVKTVQAVAASTKRKQGEQRSKKSEPNSKRPTKKSVRREPAKALMEIASNPTLFVDLFVRSGFIGSMGHEVMALGSTCKAFLPLRTSFVEVDIVFEEKNKQTVLKYPSRFIRQLAKCSNLQAASLKGLHGELNHEFAGVLQTGDLCSLRELSLKDAKRDGFNSVFTSLVAAPLPSLRSLCLADGLIGASGWREASKALKKMPSRKLSVFMRLEELNLKKVNLTEGTAFGFFNNLVGNNLKKATAPPLTRLVLSGNRIGEKAMTCLATAFENGAFPQLVEFGLTHDKTLNDGLCAVLVSAIATHCTQLEVLAFGSNDRPSWSPTALGNGTIAAFTEVIKARSLKSLTRLELLNVEATDCAAYEAFTSAALSQQPPALPNLRALSFIKHRMKRAKASRLLHLCLQRGLKYINLSMQELSSEDIILLAGVIKAAGNGTLASMAGPLNLRGVHVLLKVRERRPYYGYGNNPRLTYGDHARATSNLPPGLRLTLDDPF